MSANSTLVIIDALGIRPDIDAETCRANVMQLWEEGPVGHERRAAVAGVFASQSMEFKEHNVEYGFRATSSAVIADATAEPDNEDDIRIYRPDTRPGSPLPHAWVYRSGERWALREVAPPTHWMLIAGEDGAAWCAGAREAAGERGISLEAVRVGHVDGDWLDPRLAFIRARQFGRAGAILVRPDRVIAWRSFTAAEHPAEQIGAAFDYVLARARKPE
jgi:2,4-dichlorophenol 6-monooxygenase